jgi:hypothetical protein
MAQMASLSGKNQRGIGKGKTQALQQCRIEGQVGNAFALRLNNENRRRSHKD